MVRIEIVRLTSAGVEFHIEFEDLNFARFFPSGTPVHTELVQMFTDARRTFVTTLTDRVVNALTIKEPE